MVMIKVKYQKFLKLSENFAAAEITERLGSRRFHTPLNHSIMWKRKQLVYSKAIVFKVRNRESERK